MKKAWIEWFDGQTRSDQRAIAVAALEELIRIDYVRFRADDSEDAEGNPIPEDEVVEECLYWESCGDDLRDG